MKYVTYESIVEGNKFKNISNCVCKNKLKYKIYLCVGYEML